MDEREDIPLLSKSTELVSKQRNGISIGSDESPKLKSASSDPLSVLQRLSYGLGHVYNDLCAAMWFSYTLLFLQTVLEMESTTAGSMMLLGQVMDAIATPFVGVLADRWGNKRIWHLAGSLLVLVSFPLIFSRCLGCWMATDGSYLRWWQPLYYAIVIIVFQIGWAIVQISHLAMIPMLTENLNERSELTAIRYIAYVCSGVTVYMITWTILHIDGNKMKILPEDDYKFRDVALIITAVGFLLSVVFHFGLHRQIKTTNRKRIEVLMSNVHQENNQREKISVHNENKIIKNRVNEKDSNDSNIPVKKNFFISLFLYQVTFLYVASRLFCILSLIYVPLYLDERLNMPESTETVESIASVPLAVYISSFFASLALKYVTKYINHKILYIFGSIISISVCIWIATILTPSSGPYQLYSVAAFLGIGSSITMVTSLCITADMIGSHSNQGALVYSIVTFADKLISGLAVIIIEYFKCTNKSDCPDYYRIILAYICGGSATLGLFTMLICEIKTVFRWFQRRK